MRAVKLYFGAMSVVIPFVILQLVLGLFSPNYSEISSHLFGGDVVSLVPINWYHLGAFTLVQAFLSACILLATYEFYQYNTVSFSVLCVRICRKFPKYVLSSLVFAAPVILLGLSIALTGVNNSIPNFPVIILIAAATVIYSVYAVMTQLVILTKRVNPIGAINRSWLLVDGYWLDTFLLLSMFAILEIVFKLFLKDAVADYFSIIVSIPYSIALLVVHHDNLVALKN